MYSIMMSTILHIALLPMLVALFVVMLVHPTLVKIARSKRLVDSPNARKLNKQPVPVLGGVGVLFGIMVGVGLSGCVVYDVVLPAPILIGMIILLYTGVADDILDLRPRLKLLLQSFGVMLLAEELYPHNLYGLWGLFYLAVWLSVAGALIAGVGIINAMNLIDGVDGLCALYALYASLLFGFSFLMAGDYAYAALAFAVMGSLIPFMLHNLYGSKYKMFLGDGGSLVIGYVCVVYVLRQLQCEQCAAQGSSLAFSFAVMAVPVCDTLRVMTMRIVGGSSPFRPDKTHLHHLFISLGMSHLSTAFCVVGLDLVVLMAWAMSVVMGASDEWQLLVSLVAGVFATWGVYYSVERAMCRNGRIMRRLRCAIRRNVMHHAPLTERLRRILDDRV